MPLDENGQVIPSKMTRHLVIEVEVADHSEEAWNEATLHLESAEATLAYMHPEVRVIHPSMSMSKGRERHIGWEGN